MEAIPEDSDIESNNLLKNSKHYMLSLAELIDNLDCYG